MGKLVAFAVVVIFVLLIVGGAQELHLPTGTMLEQTPTPAPTRVPVLAMVGSAATKASEVPVCNAGVLLAAALVFGTFCAYQALSRSE